jgi:hypothetical protein
MVTYVCADSVNIVWRMRADTPEEGLDWYKTLKDTVEMANESARKTKLKEHENKIYHELSKLVIYANPVSVNAVVVSRG